MSRGTAFEYASSHPPTAKTGHSIAEKSSHTEPCRQNASRRWCRSQVSSQRPLPRRRREPQLAPAVAHDGRIGRARVVGEHGRGPAEVVEEERAAHVVDVVRVAVVGRARRENRAQRGRAASRDLECVEPAPGVAHHSHPAGAPRLGGEPGDDLHRVVLLEREVLVGENAIRVAAAAHVDADARVAVSGDVGMRERVPLRGPLAPAIRQIFEDGRHRARLGIDREPHARREPRPVLQRDPDRITPLDRARERAHGGHGAALYRLVARARSAGRAAQIGRSEPRDRRYPEGSLAQHADRGPSSCSRLQSTGG